jgi:hypothetical protein
MKTKKLLFSLAVFSAVTCMYAQTDMTPSNWKFSTKTLGPASSIFIKESSAIGGNLVYGKTTPDGHKGFRAADSYDGAIVVNNWTGAADGTEYPAMTPAQQSNIDAYINAFQFVDGGQLGNLLCYQGNGSTNTRLGAVKNTQSMSAPSLNIFTQKDLPVGTYMVTFSIRTIMNAGVNPKTVSAYVATSWFDQLMYSGSTTGISFNIDCAPAFNADWTTYQYEFDVTSNSDPLYDLTPVNLKLGINNWDITNTTIILLNSLKLEKVTAATLGGAVKITYPTFNDTPTAIKNIADDNKFIVWGANNVINVVDAKSPVEVFNTAGSLIGKAVNSSALTTLSVPVKGTYLVKVGNQTRKVVVL